MDKAWILESSVYNEEQHLGKAPVYSLGNGFMCCRGFFEEQQSGIESLGGIYMNGVFGRADYKPWKGDGHALANTPNFFRVHITVDGESVCVSKEKISDFHIMLNLKEGTLTRSYTWTSKTGIKINLTFERFISWHCLHVAGQRISVKALSGNPAIVVQASIDAEVSNLNLISSEPLPVQPGLKMMEVLEKTDNSVKVIFPIPDKTRIYEKQNVAFNHASDGTLVMSKIVVVATTLECDEAYVSKVDSVAHACLSYEEELQRHIVALQKKWHTADIQITGKESDQIALRYNILQLMQACPEHDSRYSIGARGLSGEMYEGSVFWDTEIFMLPFFTFSNPQAAQNLLRFRHHTLPESRLHAQSNYFKGAMYGWQVNEKGVEQTPAGVGAYYSIHVIADIAYAILEYWYASGDEDFMTQYGGEILIETARFWQSRVQKDTEQDIYHILAVRGPNEYDVLVNNNTYTNIMARENMRLAIDFISLMKQKHSAQWELLAAKLHFADGEIPVWEDIIAKIKIPYNKKENLYEEDDTYMMRRVIDMKKMKPTAKRIIDTTIPYEALPLYQISKQADVLHVMKNLPWLFTPEQIHTAWNFYEPKTAFDSSLAYSMHSLMAARLGLAEKAYSYFDVSANLDIRDVQLNTISGLHYANFGGTWQAAVFGFAGIRIEPSYLDINPHLPEVWDEMRLRICYQGGIFALTLSKTAVSVLCESAPHTAVCLKILENDYVFAKEGEQKTKEIV